MELVFPERLAAEKRTLITDAAERMDAEHGEGLLGLILSGSAGRGLDTDLSDLDVLVILTPEVASGPQAPSLHTAELELIPLTLEHVEAVAGFGSGWYGFRWSYAWAPVLLDRTGGRISRAVERQTRLTHAESMTVLIDHARLDGWINLVYRALKSARDGNDLAAALDGSESIHLFLDVIFALEGQVRPYNKYLRWALRNHPLTGWPTETLLELLPRLGSGEPAALRFALRRVEQLCSTFGEPQAPPAQPAPRHPQSPHELRPAGLVGGFVPGAAYAY